MLITQNWYNYSTGALTELQQSLDEGKKMTPGDWSEAKAIDAMPIGSQKRLNKLNQWIDDCGKLKADEDLLFNEPDELERIQALRPASEYRTIEAKLLSIEAMHDKIYGAWLGRCAGCLLGKPFEGMLRQRITGFAKDTANYPFTAYASSSVPEEIADKYAIRTYWAANSFIDHVTHAPIDDDTNYTVLGLNILEKFGVEFTSADVAEAWLDQLPALWTCTAEFVAYRNVMNKVYPPQSASYRNPYREWIGAQIRADIYGYVTPGNPELGAELAWRDAAISHTRNGLYGSMFVAAMLSAAYLHQDPKLIIAAGLAQIPADCRLTLGIRQVLQWRESGLDWESAVDRLYEIYDETNSHHAVHTIPNAMIVVLALLYGDGDFEQSIAIAVLSGLDTDCNGATVGSIVGLMLGAQALPAKWIEPLDDRLDTSLRGMSTVCISDLARKTQSIASIIATR